MISTFKYIIIALSILLLSGCGIIAEDNGHVYLKPPFINRIENTLWPIKFIISHPVAAIGGAVMILLFMNANKSE